MAALRDGRGHAEKEPAAPRRVAADVRADSGAGAGRVSLGCREGREPQGSRRGSGPGREGRDWGRARTGAGATGAGEEPR